MLHLFGDAVAPETRYEVRVINDSGGESDSLIIQTAKWGDIVQPFHEPGSPVTQPDFLDVGAVVDKFKGLAHLKAQTQLQPLLPVPANAVDFKDIGKCVDAFVGLPYPYQGPYLCHRMVLIPGGEFEMGDHLNEGQADELPIHVVYVDSFHTDVFEVSNVEYVDYLNSAFSSGLIEVRSGVVYAADGVEGYCNTTDSSSFSGIEWDGGAFGVTTGKEDHPVVDVTWYGAGAYANWRSTQQGRTPCYDLSTWDCDFEGNGYRLPTEAEWEYAARGGTYARYPWGDTIDGSMANYWDSGDPYEIYSPPTTPVGYYDGNQVPAGTDMANAYGLYDVAGNVWEWCNDWYDSDYYGSSPFANPTGPAGDTHRVLRGGAWSSDTSNMRCADRNHDMPGNRYGNCGFRLVLHSK